MPERLLLFTLLLYVRQGPSPFATPSFLGDRSLTTLSSQPPSLFFSGFQFPLPRSRFAVGRPLFLLFSSGVIDSFAAPFFLGLPFPSLFSDLSRIVSEFFLSVQCLRNFPPSPFPTCDLFFFSSPGDRSLFFLPASLQFLLVHTDLPPELTHLLKRAPSLFPFPRHCIFFVELPFIDIEALSTPPLPNREEPVALSPLCLCGTFFHRPVFPALPYLFFICNDGLVVGRAVPFTSAMSSPIRAGPMTCLCEATPPVHE